ncbi:hypothetical protein B0H10DRAFT_284244 [Mycena sp. CBHHK59/15]|nr:hypothetical protein B0H10DRAFT_284244 [Mycena sp. CBHHK59/15]
MSTPAFYSKEPCIPTMERAHLPVELMCQVLCLLDVEDLLRCGAVNRYFRNLILESSRLQFTLELAKHRMLSLLPPTDFPSYSTRLKLIRERERNWRSPKAWSELQKLTLPPTGTVYEFVGGYYANGREDENKITSGISFFELPSTEPSSANDPLKTWTHAMSGIKIVDFTMDPAQDLLVLVALAPPQCESVYQLHLRSFTSNEPHPESALPMLSCLPKITDYHVPLETTGAVRVQVAGDLVALLVKEVHDSVSAHLQIWNWRHGAHYSCAMARMAGIEDFTFLSDNTFLIIRPSGRFECYTFENPISCSTVPVLKSSYNLPPLQDGFMYWYICMSSNPSPGYVPPGEGTGNRVYYPRPEERIHACCLYIFKPTGMGDHRVHSFVFFLNVKMFLDPLSSHKAPLVTPEAVDPFSTAYSSAQTTFADVLGSSSWTSAQSLSSQPPSDSMSDQPHPFQLFSPHSSFFTPVNMQQLAFPPPPTPAAVSRSRQMHLRSLLISSGVQPIPWDEWGPQNTRWFDESLSTDWQHALYGLKTVECVDPFNPQPPVPRDPDDADPEYEGEDGDENQPLEAEAHPRSVDVLNLPTVNDLLNGIGFDGIEDDDAVGDGQQPNPGLDQTSVEHSTRHRLVPAMRHLRIRDYNPYSLLVDKPEEKPDDGAGEVLDGFELFMGNTSGREKGKGKEKVPSRWARRIVTTSSVTSSRGVFVKDIVSSLPYSEVISEEKFHVTDVMMDDCRVLLMQRGKGGKLKGIDILTM